MKRRFIRIIIAMLVVVGLPLAAWRLYLAHVISRELAQIRTAGLPANGEELDQWYATVPDDQNVAVALQRAFELRRTYPDHRSNLVFNFKLPECDESLSPEDVALLRGYIELNDAALKQSDEALKLPSCRYPIDCTKLMHTELPHLAELRNLARLYHYSAFVEMESGNTAAADSSIVSLLALARTLDREPCLISQLVRFKLIGMAFSTLERRVNAGPLASPEIASLAAAFRATHTSNSIVLAMIGERALTLPYFRMTRAEFARPSPSQDSEESKTDSPLPCHGPAILRLIGYYDLDYVTYLKGMSRAIGMLGNPPPDNLRATGYFARTGGESKERHRTLSGMLLSAYAGSAGRGNEAVARRQLALTALALERFRNDNNTLPESLEELVPKYLGEVPEDPFTGWKLIYRHTETGGVLYSVGRDLEDDGGLEESAKQQSDDGKSYDITFTVER